MYLLVILVMRTNKFREKKREEMRGEDKRRVELAKHDIE